MDRRMMEIQHLNEDLYALKMEDSFFFLQALPFSIFQVEDLDNLLRQFFASPANDGVKAKLCEAIGNGTVAKTSS